jgi:hypothetical protein
VYVLFLVNVTALLCSIGLSHVVDEFRRLATEAAVPFLAARFKTFSVSKSSKGNGLRLKKVEVCA